MSPDITQDDVFRALRAALVAALPSGTEVVRGYDNRVPMPPGQNFVVISLSGKGALAQTVHGYAGATQEIEQSTAFHAQADFYGDVSGDLSQTAMTLLRDEWSVGIMKPFGVAPLSCVDPTMAPLLPGEQQYVERWTLRIDLQATPVVSVPQQFADNLVTALQEII